MSANLHGIEYGPTFGKYKGKKWEEVSNSYVLWLISEMAKSGKHAWGSKQLGDVLSEQLLVRKLL